MKLKYKGYEADVIVEYFASTGGKPMLTACGETLEEVEAEFQKTVDDYLDWKEEKEEQS